MDKISKYYAVDPGYFPPSPISSRASSRAASPAPPSPARGNLYAPAPVYPGQGSSWSGRGTPPISLDSPKSYTSSPTRSFSSYPALESSHRSHSPSSYFSPPASRSSSPMRMSPHPDPQRSLRHTKSFVEPSAAHNVTAENRTKMAPPPPILAPSQREAPATTKKILSTPHPELTVLCRPAAVPVHLPSLGEEEEEESEAPSPVTERPVLRASKSHGSLGRRSHKASGSGSRYEAFPPMPTGPRNIPQPLPNGQSYDIVTFRRRCYDDFGQPGRAAMRSVQGLDIKNPTIGLENPSGEPLHRYDRYQAMRILFEMPGYPRASSHGETRVSSKASWAELANAACSAVKEVIAVIRNTKEPCARACAEWTVGTARGIGIEDLTPMALLYAGGGVWYVSVRCAPRV